MIFVTRDFLYPLFLLYYNRKIKLFLPNFVGSFGLSSNIAKPFCVVAPTALPLLVLV